jgi:hypothetical protein
MPLQLRVHGRQDPHAQPLQRLGEKSFFSFCAIGHLLQRVRGDVGILRELPDVLGVERLERLPAWPALRP